MVALIPFLGTFIVTMLKQTFIYPLVGFGLASVHITWCPETIIHIDVYTIFFNGHSLENVLPGVQFLCCTHFLCCSRSDWSAYQQFLMGVPICSIIYLNPTLEHMNLDNLTKSTCCFLQPLVSGSGCRCISCHGTGNACAGPHAWVVHHRRQDDTLLKHVVVQCFVLFAKGGYLDVFDM